MKPLPQDRPPPLPPITPVAGEAPTASFQETPGAESPPHVNLGVGARPLPEYELTAKLGQGGYGEVWRAKGPGGFDVALKFLRLGDASGSTELKALQTIKGVRHPNLLSVFGVWEKDSHLIVAMELADRSLIDRLKEAVRESKPGIPAPELLDYMLDAARGLDFLNEKGIQHRDVKPHNLFLYGRGVKVADFGLAKVLGGLMATASAKMTPAYAAPEFLNGQASRWSDQYSLAVTYCQLRTNKLPFEGTALEILSGHMVRQPDLAQLPATEQLIVARALSKEPQQRWPTCRAFVEALMFAQGVMPAVTPPGIPVQPPSIPREEKRTKTVTLPPAPPTVPARPSAERIGSSGRTPRTPVVPSVLPRPPAPPSVLPVEPVSTFPWIVVIVLGLLFVAGLGTGVIVWLLNQPDTEVKSTARNSLPSATKSDRTVEKEAIPRRHEEPPPDDAKTKEKPLDLPPKVARQPWPVDKLLPNDADAILHLDCRAFLQTELVNRHLREPLQKMLRTEPFDKVMQTIAFDPLQDLDSLTLTLSDLKATTSSSGKDVKGFFLCKGRFTPEKIKTSLEAATSEAQRNQRGEFSVYEVKGTNGTTEMFCALLDDSTLIAGTHKELVTEVCDRVSQDRSPHLKPQLIRALSQIRRRQTFWMAMAFPDWMRDQIRSTGGTAEPFAKITELTLHLSVTDSIQLEIEGFVDDTAAVTPLKNAMEQMKPLLAAVPAQSQLEDKTLAEDLGRLFSNMSVTTRKSSVVVHLECPSHLAEKIIDLTKKNAPK